MNLNILPGQTICLGYQTENLVEAVVFDKTAWVNEYGPGTFEFVHKRRQDSDALPIAISASGGIVTWTITASDVAYRGAGEAQLRYYNAQGQIKASEIYQTQVARSLVSDTDVPEPYEGWVEQVLAAAAGIQNMLVDAETLPPGSAATVTKTVDPETGVVTLSFGLPEGVGIQSMTVLPSGEWKVVYTDGTEEIVGEDVYSAMHALEQAAENAKNAAETARDKSAQWATGGSEGTPSATNNAKYYAEQADDANTAAQGAKTAAGVSAENAEKWATGQTEGTPSATNNAKYYAEQAGNANTAAQGAKNAAGVSAENAEKWATGQTEGEPSATNNAKYYADQAGNSATAAAGSATAAAASAASGIAALANEAPTFSSSTAYAAGSYVIYNSTLYRFTAAHAAGAWTGSDATAVKIGPELADVKSAFLLETENIENTTQTIIFAQDGSVSSIVHKDGSNNTIRTDAFTFAGNTITEVRTLYTGESLTIVTNTDTLTTTVTYAAA